MSLREKSETEIYCEIKDAFQIFDKDNDGVITKEEEQTIMRMFGINPEEKKDQKNEGQQQEGQPNANQSAEEKEKEKEEKKEEVQPENQTVEFNEFFDNIQHKLKDAENDEELLAETDPLTVNHKNELTHELVCSKEKISEDLINKLITDSRPDENDYIVYKNFLSVALNKY